MNESKLARDGPGTSFIMSSENGREPRSWPVNKLIIPSGGREASSTLTHGFSPSFYYLFIIFGS